MSLLFNNISKYKISKYKSVDNIFLLVILIVGLTLLFPYSPTLPSIFLIFWFVFSSLRIGIWLSGLTTLAGVLVIFLQWIEPTVPKSFVLIHLVALIGLIITLSSQAHERFIHHSHLHTMQVLLRQQPALSQTVDFSREAVLVIDNSKRIILSTSHASKLLSVNSSDIEGMNILDLSPSLLNLDTIDGEFVWKGSDKKEKVLRYMRRPLLDQNTPSGIMLILSDATEEKKRFESYLQAAKFSVISQVAGGVAHELRNPLTTIKGFMQLIGPEQWPEQFRQYHQLILDEIQTTNNLISEFILLTNPSAPHLKPLNPIDLINSCMQILQPTFNIKEVCYRQDLPPNSPMILGDEEQLRQTILSILQNAIEASLKGDLIQISLENYEDTIRIMIDDSGEGIPPEFRSRVFDPFFTTRNKKTGLGLTIAKQIILAHKGQLDLCDGDTGKGTKVFITLPVALV